MNKNKIRFGHDDVLRIYGKAAGGFRGNGSSHTYRDCPFCGKYYTFNVNVEKNVYNCPACDRHGGDAVKLFIALSEHKEDYVGDAGYKKAVREIFNAIKAKKIIPSGSEAKPSAPETPKAAPERIDAVYRVFAAVAGLRKEHADNIRRRGIDPVKYGKRFLFCSVPEDPKIFMKKFLKALKERTGSADLTGVPGFFKANGEWRMLVLMKPGYVVRTGFFCFAFDENGRATGAQIRLDDLRGEPTDELAAHFKGGKKEAGEFLDYLEEHPEIDRDALAAKYIARGADLEKIREFDLDEEGHYTIRRCELPKYVWFSSNKEGSAPSGAISTFLRGEREDIVIVTEGILKAMVIYVLLHEKVTVIGVPGVNSLGGLEPYLEVIPKNALVVEAYDMDKAMNLDTVSKHDREKTEKIHKAEEKLLSLLHADGFATHTMKWDFDEAGLWKGNLKGLDDYLDERGEPTRKAFLEYLFTLYKKSRSAA